MRRRADERETERRDGEAPATVTAPPAAYIARLQQSAGNQAVAALLARQPADTEYDTEPHEGGDASELAKLLEQGSEPAQAWVRDTWDLFGSGPDDAPVSTDPVHLWLSSKPATNQAYAQWVVDGVTTGFVVWTGSDSEAQMKKLAANEKAGSADPKQTEILGALKTIRALVAGKAEKWKGDKTKPKETVGVGSFIRRDGGPHDGRAIDVNGLDWAGTKGPGQVEEALRALPAGSYGIGLPFQGQFFPKDEWLKERQDAAVAAAGAGGTPAPITQPSLEKWVGTRFTAVFKDGKWQKTPTTGQAFDRLRSSTLKAAITELNGKGYKIYVFPDNDRHIHIQSP
jgi:hypothetical protein